MVRGGSGEDGTWYSTGWHLAERSKAGSADTLRGLSQILGVGPHTRAQDTSNTDSLLVLWVEPHPIPLLHIPVGTEAEFSLSTWSNPHSNNCRAGKGQDLA